MYVSSLLNFSTYSVAVSTIPVYGYRNQGSEHLHTVIMGLLSTVVSTYPRGISSNTTSGCLKLRIILDPVHTVSPINTYMHTFSQLLFGILELPVLLLFCFGPLLNKIKVTGTMEQECTVLIMVTIYNF